MKKKILSLFLVSVLIVPQSCIYGEELVSETDIFEEEYSDDILTEDNDDLISEEDLYSDEPIQEDYGEELVFDENTWTDEEISNELSTDISDNDIILSDENSPDVFQEDVVIPGEEYTEENPEVIADDTYYEPDIPLAGLYSGDPASDDPDVFFTDTDEPDIIADYSDDSDEFYTEDSGDAANGCYSNMISGKLMANSKTYNSCYADQLSADARRIYDAMLTAWGNGGSDKITVYLSSPLPYTVLKNENGVWVGTKADTNYLAQIEYVKGYTQQAIDAFLYDHPEVYWLKSLSFSTDKPTDAVNLIDGNIPDICSIKYINISGVEKWSGAKNSWPIFASAVDSAVNTISEAVLSETTSARKVKIIRDFIINNASYNDGTYAHTAYGFFCGGGNVVCEGYGKAMKILCDRFGLICAMIPGDMCYDDITVSHLWNHVKLDDGHWYLVDLSSDDQTIEDIYLFLGKNSSGKNHPISEERIIYNKFSSSKYTQTFAAPAIYSDMYHEYEPLETKDSSCTENGYISEKCIFCGDIHTEDIPAHGHIPGTYHTEKEATVFEAGLKTATCTVCKEPITEEIPKLIPALAVIVKNMIEGENTPITVTMKKGDSVTSVSSSDPDIVSVTGMTAYAKNPGTATISVTTKSGITKKTDIKVTEKKRIVAHLSAKDIVTDASPWKTQTAQISITQNTGGGALSYSCSSKSVTVDRYGKVTVPKNFAGTATVIINAAKTDKYTEAQTSITVRVNKIPGMIKVSPISMNASDSKTQTKNIVITSRTGFGNLTYTSNKSAVKVSDTGRITVAKNFVGTANITVKSESSGIYESAFDTVTVTVNKIAGKITANNFTVTSSENGQSFQIGAKRLGNGKLSYTVNSSHIKVYSTGRVFVPANYSGKVYVTIKAAESGIYKSATKKITVTVNPQKSFITKYSNYISKRIYVQWKMRKSCSGYEIQYSTDPSFMSGSKKIYVRDRHVISRNINGVKVGTTYYLRVRTYKTAGSNTYYSAWSNIKMITVTK